MLRLAEAVWLALSVTSTVKAYVPVAVGSPEIVPWTTFNFRPVGKEPEVTLHEYGGDPPVACNCVAYFRPSAPLGKRVVVITSEFDVIAMLRFAVAVLLALSVASTVKLETPTVVGVPEITPVLVPSDNPAGKLPAVTPHVYGGVPPTAVKLVEYGTPTVPFGKHPATIFSIGATVSVAIPDSTPPQVSA
jgi:hypothetical protein